MLHQGKVIAALASKRDSFTLAEEITQQDLASLNQALRDLGGLSLDDIINRLEPLEAPGARPTEEHERFQDVVISFTERWNNHRQAREWALDILQDVPTFAADGSQISPSKDISIPVGVVQVGWFENRHETEGSYNKDVAVEVLSPRELSGDEKQTSGFVDWQIDLRRFTMEVERLADYMESNAGREPKPLCFFDGSLIVSFVERMHPNQQKYYVDAIVKLLQVSKETRVALLGYVDTSFARDFSTMLTHILDIQLTSQISDGTLFQSRMNWGDRSQVYICAREDGVLANYYEKVCFTYLKTTSGNPPARIEFPRWIYESGEHEQLLNLARAECVVGTGYPYVLESADAVAVLTMQDRERFLRLFQEFTERESIPLRFSRKAVSKRGRR